MMPGQGFRMQMLPALPEPALTSGPGAARLHAVDCGFRAAEKTPVLGLPPRVDDHGLALSDDVVVPLPDLGLDGLADGGHVLEVIVVLRGLVRTRLAEHSD